MSRPSRRFLTLVAAALAVTFVFVAVPASPARAQNQVPPRNLLATLTRHRLPPPLLIFRRPQKRKPMELATVKIDARIVGHQAETTMTLSFYNPNNAVLEGDLVFPLPEGATISGYALDINGQLVDGVIVDKDEAREVFEEEVRKGVDPGLVEATRGNSFKTRIFPIPAKGSRTIRVSYVSEVLPSNRGALYYLPLAFKQKVKSLALRVEVVKASAKPQIVYGGSRGLSFGAWRDSFVASTKLQDTTLNNDLYVALPKIETRPLHVEKTPDGQLYFSLRDRVRSSQAPASRTPARIGLYWDASLSRAKVDHRQELALLDTYLQSLGATPVTVSLIILRNIAERARTFRLPAHRQTLLQALKTLRYDGGTQLGAAVPQRAMKKVDLNLLFSDGLSNFGEEDPRALKAPVYTINAATTAEHTFLRYLALRTGGAYLNLRRLNPKQAAAAIGKPVFSFLSAEIKKDASQLCLSTGQAPAEESYPKLPTSVHGTFDLAGHLPCGHGATIVVRYGYGSRVTQTKRFTVHPQDASSGTLLARAFAAKKIADLAVFPERNAQHIASVGKRYGIVTPKTSLIVLETLSQYVAHQIRPPKMLPKMRASWDRTMAQRRAQKKRQDASKLSHVLALWKSRMAWWRHRFRYPKNYRYHRPHNKKGRPRPRQRRVSETIETRALGSIGRSGGGAVAPMVTAKTKMPATGTHAEQRPRATITMKPWDPKTPYLKTIKAAPAARRYAVYLAQRKAFGTAPAFYLDCAHYFRTIKKPAVALRILSNLAELELENPALIRVLAHRLAQVGELDLAIRLFETVKRLRPEEPQSYRDLALVLERRGDRERRQRRGRDRGSLANAHVDYLRALRLLSTVVMRRWKRFDEIEVIALTELNHILPKAKRLGKTAPPVDQRLIQPLTLDVRIVMTWDADSTDMDLHVIEPSKEEAYFSNNRTHIGGLVSRDFTQGYGPEIYGIRHAMRGVYAVRTKFYGSSAAKLIGAVTLQVDVYTNYGRKNERRRSMTLRLTKRKEIFTVGKIRF